MCAQYTRKPARRRQAALGFIVVMIDGMGTFNRSKAFHDVAWKRVGDAGFPDRILRHKAIAAKYPYYDITRVGIYGGSVGGQNSTGALLFHPDFYDAAVSYVGYRHFGMRTLRVLSRAGWVALVLRASW